MIKIYKEIKSNRLYIGSDSYSKNEQFSYTRNGDKFTLSKLHGGFPVLVDMYYTEFVKQDGSSFLGGDEFEDLMKAVVGDDLKVYRILPPGTNPLTTDFTILGLSKQSPSYERGRKTKAEYLDPNNDDLVVEKIFSDLRDNNDRLTGIEIVFNWYDETGAIGLTKTEQAVKFNKYEAETEERKRRERQIDYLIAGAKDSPIEAFITAIFEHYHIEQLKYKESGSSDFAAAINSETNSTILQYQAIMVPRIDDPNKTISVKNSMLYQIGDKTLAEIEAE